MISNNNGDIENNGGGDTNNSQNPLPTYIIIQTHFQQKHTLFLL